jgi:hypothetical protein
MKKPVIVWPFLSVLAFMLVSFGFSLPRNRQQPGPSANNGIAVVELFTSEGCSSCPPADEAVAALSDDYPATVFVLGFHVDYWNYLGWKDPFSSAAWSTRQQAYAGAFALSSIYTPQVVVNGRYQFTGSDKIRLYSTVEKELAKNLPAGVELKATTNGQYIQVNYTATGAEKSWLHFALVQRQASSTVQRGENRGKQLHHIDVVRDFITSASVSGFVNLHLPAGCKASDLRVIGFVQQKEDLHVNGAAACSIQ